MFYDSPNFCESACAQRNDSPRDVDALSLFVFLCQVHLAQPKGRTAQAAKSGLVLHPVLCQDSDGHQPPKAEWMNVP